MSEASALAAFQARRSHPVLHDLSGSDSQTLPLADLLALAEPDDLARWQALGLGYADPRGAPWLRDAIARRHPTLKAADIVCCTGAQEAVACVARALLGRDDHAVVLLPIYRPSEQAVTSLCAATGIGLETGTWRLDLDRVAAAIRPNTRLLLANFPNSPTGAALDASTLDGLVALCRRHGLWLVNDEIYRQTSCAPEAAGLPAVADAYERGISINGLSKGFGLPGLRVGWAACRDRDVLSGLLEAKGMGSSCLSSASEVLAHVALRAEPVITERTRAIGHRNRERLSVVLERSSGLLEADPMPNLAFAFPRCAAPEGAERFAGRLLREAGLLVLPATLWHSALARTPRDQTPRDHLRIGLGHASCASGLAILDRSLACDRAARADRATRPAPAVDPGPGRAPLAARA